MYDSALLIERLGLALQALERIPRRFAGVDSAEAFEESAEGRDRLDAICMVLIAAGETFRQIDVQTEGRLLLRYPEVDWRGVIGVRNVIAHAYFDIDVEQVFDICQRDIPVLIETVQKMIKELRQRPTS
jgi:uncharacterized protein with HEPN domain